MLGLPWRRRAEGIPSHVEKWSIDAGRYIGNALVNVERVGVRLERRRIGPHIALFEFTPLPPSTANVQKLLKAGPLIKATIRVPRVHIREERGLVVVRVPHPYAQPLDPFGFEGGAGFIVPVGLRDDGAADVLDFDATPHAGIFGPTNAGKTTIARMIVLHLARQNSPDELRLFVVGLNPADWRAVNDLPHSWGFIPHEEAEPAVDWLEKEFRRRQGAKSPRIVALFDDMAALVAAQPDLGSRLGTLSSVARHAGIHLIIISQKATKAGGGDPLALANMPRRFIVGAATASEAAWLTGRSDTGAHELGVGEAVSVGAVAPSVIAVPNADASCLARLGVGAHEAAPWLRDTIAAPRSLGRVPVQEPLPDSRVISFVSKRPASARSGEALPLKPAPNGQETGETDGNGRNGTANTSQQTVIAPNQVVVAETGNGKRERVRAMLLKKASQGAILKEIWNVTPGGGYAYKDATEELREIIAGLIL